jgi:hypothetical protein
MYVKGSSVSCYLLHSERMLLQYLETRNLCIVQAINGQNAEPVFVNVYGAQESIPRNRFRQPM